ncbi:hypothetical protein D3C80_1145870 [compost metagenome]
MGEDERLIGRQQRRRHCLLGTPTGREQAAKLPAQALQCIQGLWAAQAQGDLPALVEALVKHPESPLERGVLQGKGKPVAGMKAA